MKPTKQRSKKLALTKSAYLGGGLPSLNHDWRQSALFATSLEALFEPKRQSQGRPTARRGASGK